MSIASRITSIEEHIKESYQELEGIGIDTTEVDKNLENIPKLIDGYWETLPKVTEEGTSITLDNTKEGKMKIGLKGNTSQETYSGINKFVMPNSMTKNGITYTLNNDGTCNITGTATKYTPLDIYVPVDEAPLEEGNYYYVNDNLSGIIKAVQQWQGNGTGFLENISINGSSAYTKNANCNYIGYVIGISDGQTVNITNGKVILAKGTTRPSLDSWEKYVGGNPAPNPDYPQDIYVVKGENILIVNGKNLYNATKEEWTYRNVTASADNQRLYFNGTITSAGTMDFAQQFVKAGTYTLSVELESGSITTTGTGNTSGLLLYLYSTTTGSSNYIAIRADSTKGRRAVTFSKDTYVYIHAYPRPAETMTNAVIKYQLIKGDTTDYDFAPYEEHLYPLYLGGNIFYDELEVGGIDGNTGNNISINTRKRSKFYTIIEDDIQFTLSCNENDIQCFVMCYDEHKNFLGKVTNDWSNVPYTFTPLQNTELVRLLFKNTEGTTAPTITNLQLYKAGATPIELCKIVDYQDRIFKNTPNTTDYDSNLEDNVWYLKKEIGKIESYNGETITTSYKSTTGGLDTGATVYYGLTTPTDTQITDSTLISQLEALNGAKSYTTQTNISQENNDNVSILNASALENM